MKYTVTIYRDIDRLVGSIDSCTTAQARKFAAQEAASQENRGARVYVEWLRPGDGQRGYLNPDGNHAITGIAW